MHIFISYAKNDTRDLALDLHAALNALPDVTAWTDESLQPGENWDSEIEEQIDLCDWMIVLLSPDVNRKKTRTQDESFVRKEIHRALYTSHKPVLPVMAQTTALPVVLGTLQYIPFSEHASEGIAWLVEQICAGIGIAVAPSADSLPDPVSVPGSPGDAPKMPAENVLDLIDEFSAARAKGDWYTARDCLAAIALLSGPPWFKPEKYSREVQDQIGLIEAEQKRQEEIAAAQRAQRQREATAAREYSSIRNLAEHDSTEGWEALRVFRATYPFYGDPADLLFTLNPFQLPPPFEWIDIPAGRVTLEDASEGYKSPGTKGGSYEVVAFKIAKYPVTNGQYDVFVNDPQGYANSVWWNYSPDAKAWRDNNPESRDTAFPGDDLPRTNVSWYDAVAFCRWFTARLNGLDSPLSETPPLSPLPMHGEGMGVGLRIMLPTEQQWQRAAQGDDGREYPWGNQAPDENLCNFRRNVGHPTPVTQYLGGANPYGVMDMSGNVWEWCLTAWGTDSVSLAGSVPRVLRGGAWSLDQFSARATFRRRRAPFSRLNDLGFRVVTSRSE